MRFSSWFRVIVALLALVVAAPSVMHAQTHPEALSDAEVDGIREARDDPAKCILLFVKYLDDRAQRVQDMYSKPRRPGREEDTHDIMEQFTSISDELSDNLEDYGKRHADLRKALPKVLQAAERWTTQLKTPPEDPSYSIGRKLALESIQDLQDSTKEMVPEQEAWFKEHLPEKGVKQPGKAPVQME